MVEMERQTMGSKHEEIYRTACDLYSEKPDWGTFHREILGINGLVRRSFPTPDALARFEKSETYQQIHQLLRSLREQPPKIERKPKKKEDGDEQDENVSLEQGEEDARQEMKGGEEEDPKDPPKNEEPTRVITVRLPRSLHEALRAEAHIHQTSMNKLCISKLLQLIDDALVPNEARESE